MLEFVTSSIPNIDPSQSSSNKHSRLPHVVPSVDHYNDTIYVPSYVPSVNPSGTLNEQQVGVIQEVSRTTLEQVKALENIISSVDIKVDKSAWLW